MADKIQTATTNNESMRVLAGMDLNSVYEQLAFDLDDGDKGHFLSGWQCDNPYVAEFLARVRERSGQIDHRKYVYFDDDGDLVDLILAHHARVDRRPAESVLCGSGSTALLFAVVTHLHSKGVKNIYYIPPIYFTLHRAFGWYGIQPVPVSTKQPFEDGFEIALPEEKSSVLFLTDPVWYAGKAFSRDVVQSIAEWQSRTGSIVVVDGSLQYMRWDGEAAERTALLDPALTVRLVCPSKQLCVHGYRFSYLLVPDVFDRDVAWTYANIAGPVGADSVAFAREAVAALETEEISPKLVLLASGRHRMLRDAGIIESSITPDSGYFVFEKINVDLPQGYRLVDGRYFDQSNYPDHVKINLLSPSISLLTGDAAPASENRRLAADDTAASWRR